MIHTNTHIDQRRHQRRILRVPAWISVPGATPIEVRTIDISEGGLGIAAPGNPAFGTTFTIRFGLPNASGGFSQIEAEVVVVHSVLTQNENSFKVGLSFTSMDASRLVLIRTFVSSARNWWN